MRVKMSLAMGFLGGALLLAGCGQAAASVAPKAPGSAKPAAALHLTASSPGAVLGGHEYAVMLTAKGEVKGGTYGLNGGAAPWQMLDNTCVRHGLVTGSASCTMIVEGLHGMTKFTLQERNKMSNIVVVHW